MVKPVVPVGNQMERSFPDHLAISLGSVHKELNFAANPSNAPKENLIQGLQLKRL